MIRANKILILMDAGTRSDKVSKVPCRIAKDVSVYGEGTPSAGSTSIGVGSGPSTVGRSRSDSLGTCEVEEDVD
jgi:hypothetical protein